MLDLESFGKQPGSVIVAIGACTFTEAGVGETFYETISPQSCLNAGLKVDGDTMLWWLRQSDDARRALHEHCITDLPTALAKFTEWMLAVEGATVWGNGAAFDNALLAAAYTAVPLIRRPWRHSQDRCYRTLKNLRPDIAPEPFDGVVHNALDDAKHQAWHAIALHKALGIPL